MTDTDTDRFRGVRAESFDFRYPTADGPALQDLTFEVPAGEVLGVLGPGESGKTTLAMALASFAPQHTGGTTDGTLSAAGRDTRTAEDDAVAMVFEDYGAQVTQVRVLDEVVAPLVNRGVSRADAVDRARALLEQVRLGDVAEKFTWDLSGGEQQRLAIAAALAIDPEVLLFDTATDMLDPAGTEQVRDLIADLAGDTTLVVTATDPDELVGVADRVLLLEDGEQVGFGPADEILRDVDRLRTVGVGAPLPADVAERAGLAQAGPAGVDGGPLTAEELRAALDDAAAADGSELAAADGGTTAAPRCDSGPADPDVDPTQTEAATVDASGVTYAYADDTAAVDDVDLSVAAGEVHAVIGGNGAGKSTFSKLLVGLLTPDDGHVEVAGTPTDAASAREMATSVGIALQNPDEQLAERTVEAELRFPLERRQYERTGLLSLRKEQQYDDAYVAERVDAVRDLVGIDEAMLERDPMFLPQGQRRLVSIALAVATDPDAVVLDEPTAGLDAATTETVLAAIRRLAADGTAVVLVEHDMDVVCEVADRVTLLDDGTVAAQGPPETVFARERWDELAARHVRPPRVARLARELGVEALTVDALVAELARETEVTT